MAKARFYFNFGVSQEDRTSAENVTQYFKISYAEIFRKGLRMLEAQMEQEKGA